MTRWSPLRLLGFVLLMGCAHAGRTPDYASSVLAADRAAVTFPRVGVVHPGIDLAGAYRLQGEIVRRRLRSGARIAGFKGGLMSEKSLVDRGAAEPVVGVLFDEGALSDGADVSLCGYRRAALEAKIGFVLATPISGPVRDIESLRRRIGAVLPVVELPDIAYDDDQAYTVIDMAAANVSSARFVRGSDLASPPADLDGLKVTVIRDGQSVTEGHGRESLDGQWVSLLRLVNLALAQGHALRRGQVVLTGKIGAKVNVTEGTYQANYGPLGIVRFTARSCMAG